MTLTKAISNEKYRCGKSFVLSKIAFMIFAGLFSFTNSFSQKITFDTIRNADNYRKYILLSKQMLQSIKENEDTILNKCVENDSSINRLDLKENLSWVHKLLQDSSASLKWIILEKASLPFPNYAFKTTVLDITYTLGRSDCTDPMYDNSIIISFYDISKGEEKFDLIFNNCIKSEKRKKAILAIPLPKD
jgi:hypothetical protein